MNNKNRTQFRSRSQKCISKREKSRCRNKQKELMVYDVAVKNSLPKAKKNWVEIKKGRVKAWKTSHHLKSHDFCGPISALWCIDCVSRYIDAGFFKCSPLMLIISGFFFRYAQEKRPTCLALYNMPRETLYVGLSHVT